MHMRVRPWAKPELAACGFFIKEPQEYRGHWESAFQKKQPMHLELGCGKGVSACRMAHENKNINFVAIDMISTVLGLAKRNIESEYKADAVDNILLTQFDAMRLPLIFSSTDIFERIYISFCNPWDKKVRHEKRRLTHPRQLNNYRDILADNGEIWFKTDNDKLFCDSLSYFKECGYEVICITEDLHASGFSPNYMSEHEIKYLNENKKIKFLKAAKKQP